MKHTVLNSHVPFACIEENSWDDNQSGAVYLRVVTSGHLPKETQNRAAKQFNQFNVIRLYWRAGDLNLKINAIVLLSRKCEGAYEFLLADFPSVKICDFTRNFDKSLMFTLLFQGF